MYHTLTFGILLSALVFIYAERISSVEHNPSTDLGNGRIPWITQILTLKMMTFVPSGQRKEGSQCTIHGKLYEDHLKNLTFWATKMFDSRANGVNSGFLDGNDFNMGSFDECISISVPEFGIRGKYLVANLEFFPNKELYSHFMDNITNVYEDPPDMASTWEALKPTKDLRMNQRNVIKWAICVPESCANKDMETSLRNYIYPALSSHNLWGNLSVLEEYTFSWSETIPEPDTGYYVFLIITIILITTVVVSTTVDLAFDRNTKKPWYTDFSLKEHLPSLFSMEQREFPSISGMKTMSMFCIIIGHRAIFSSTSPMVNAKQNRLWIGEIMSMFLLNGILVVNTFMVISGFLTFYKFLKDISKGKEIDPCFSIFRRWLRFVPAYIFTLAFYYYIYPRYSGGPLSRGVIWDSTICGSYWWTHLLFINNYVYPTHQCLILSWYLALDTQLYALLAILGYLYMKMPRFGIYMISSVTFIALIIPGIYIMIHHIYGVPLMYYRTLLDRLSDQEYILMYAQTHTRAASYLMGMLAAFLYDYLKKLKFTFTDPIINWPIAVFSAMLMLLSWLGPYVFYWPGRPYVLWENVVYAVLHRVAWTVPIVVGIIGGSRSNFGPIKYTIGARVFEPFNKLTYSALLVHTPIQYYLFGLVRAPIYNNALVIFWMGFGDICLAYICSTFLYCLVEAPFAALQERYFDVLKKPKIIDK